MINGATSQEHEVLMAGSYFVVTNNEFSCTSISDALFVVGLHDNATSTSLLFPNPANDKLAVVLPCKNCAIKIYNALGQVVRIGQTVSSVIKNIDVSAFPAGS